MWTRQGKVYFELKIMRRLWGVRCLWLWASLPTKAVIGGGGGLCTEFEKGRGHQGKEDHMEENFVSCDSNFQSSIEHLFHSRWHFSFFYFPLIFSFLFSPLGSCSTKSRTTHQLLHEKHSLSLLYAHAWNRFDSPSLYYSLQKAIILLWILSALTFHSS